MKKIDKLKNEIEKHIQQLGCPPNGDGTKADGSPDARCSKGGGSSRGGGSGRAKSKEKTANQTGDDIAAKSVGKANAAEKGNGSTKRPEVPISTSNTKKLVDNINNNDPNNPAVSWADGSPKYAATRNSRTGAVTVYKTKYSPDSPIGFPNRVNYEIGVLKGGPGEYTWQTTNGDNSVERDVKNLFK